MMLMSIYKIILAGVVSFVVSLFVLPHLARIASKIGLIDEPENRKIHRTARPLVGGIGMMIGVAISSLLFIPLAYLRGFYAGIILLVIIGFLDDFKEIDHSWKFLVQIIAVLFMVYLSDTILSSFGDLLSFGSIVFNRSAILLTIFSTLGVINAINMIDGLDGLAGGVSLVAFLSFSTLTYMDNQKELFLLCIAFSGALLAFLRYNWHPSKLFMGDAGSITLGFALTFLAIAMTQKRGSSIPPVVPLLVLAVPIIDTITVMTRRMLGGRSAFEADRSHLHHILLDFGLHNRTVVLIIIVLSFIFSVFGLCGIIYSIPEYYMFAVFMIYFILYFIASFYIRRILRVRQKYNDETS